jgi:hypothetical protein
MLVSGKQYIELATLDKSRNTIDSFPIIAAK